MTSIEIPHSHAMKRFAHALWSVSKVITPHEGHSAISSAAALLASRSRCMCAATMTDTSHQSTRAPLQIFSVAPELHPHLSMHDAHVNPPPTLSSKILLPF